MAELFLCSSAHAIRSEPAARVLRRQDLLEEAVLLANVHREFVTLDHDAGVASARSLAEMHLMALPLSFHEQRLEDP